GRADPNAMAGLFALLREQLRGLDAETLARDERLKTLEADLAAARQKLGASRPPVAVDSHTASIEIEAKEAGALTLHLAHVAPGASWEPAYHASLDPATGDVTWISEAIVRQTSSESWDGVALTLSTASPSRGVTLPVLSPLILRAVVDPVRGTFGQNLNSDAV